VLSNKNDATEIAADSGGKMPTAIDSSNLTRRRFLAVASTAAAASSMSVGTELGSSQSTPVQVHYVVTIDVRSGSFSYTVSPKGDPHNLEVNRGDEVKWLVKTSGPKHRGAALFIKTTPFIDAHGNPVRPFHWSDTDETSTGYSAGLAQNKGTHEYCVAVFDENTGQLYLDDPKIIVGGAALDARAEIIEAEGELKDVREKILSIEKKLGNATQKLK
jgi:plastocyanin